jgi:acetyl-CoA carboxylase carboxyltransferase component
VTAVHDRLSEPAEPKRSTREAAHPDAAGRRRAKVEPTPYERIGQLLDEGAFTEIGSLRRHRATGFGLEDRRPPSDGVITGWGTGHGRTAFVRAHPDLPSCDHGGPTV